MSGFGIYSAGFGAFGLSTPAVAPAPATGPVGSRWINPATKDYELNPQTKNLKQMPLTRQRVLLALLTIQGSSTTASRFGVSLPTKMGNTFEIECKNATRAALSHLTSGNSPDIVIDRIDVERGKSGRAQITVTYTDLNTGEQDFVSNG
jgi:hypothetical protein